MEGRVLSGVERLYVASVPTILFGDFLKRYRNAPPRHFVTAGAISSRWHTWVNAKVQQPIEDCAQIYETPPAHVRRFGEQRDLDGKKTENPDPQIRRDAHPSPATFSILGAT